MESLKQRNENCLVETVILLFEVLQRELKKVGLNLLTSVVHKRGQCGRLAQGVKELDIFLYRNWL